MLLERDGKIESHHHDGDGGCCKDKEDGDACNEHDEVAAAVSTGGDGWSKEEESLLVQLVAKDGRGDWAAKATELGTQLPREGPALSGEDTEARWILMAPKVPRAAAFMDHDVVALLQVKASLLEKEKERECGHSCGTCPTRHDCQLHEAVGIDIEDLVPIATVTGTR